MTTLTKISIDGTEYDLGGSSGTTSITTANITDWSSATAGFATSSSLATVATSGSYADLSNKPTLGSLASKSSITHSEVSDWNTATSSFLTSHQDLNGWLPNAIGKSLVDLNTIVDQGVYYVTTNTANADNHHYPIGTNGILTVFRNNSTAGSGFCQQWFRRTGTAGTNDHHIYVREASAGGTGTWGAWVQIMTSKNLSTNGGTIATTSYVDDAIAAITDADSTAY